jgi:ferritin
MALNLYKNKLDLQSKNRKTPMVTNEDSSTEDKDTQLSNPFASPECIAILNYRIEQEEQSSRLYQAMSLWLNDNGFLGAAKAWLKDAGDEMEHAQWAKEFLLDMGIQPTLPALQQPQQTFEGLCDVIEKSYQHEIVITQQCNDLAKHAMQSGNHLLYQLAVKYLHEQQEELGKLQNLLDKLQAFGEDKIAIRLLDNELGS